MTFNASTVSCKHEFQTTTLDTAGRRSTSHTAHRSVYFLLEETDFVEPDTWSKAARISILLIILFGEALQQMFIINDKKVCYR